MKEIGATTENTHLFVYDPVGCDMVIVADRTGCELFTIYGDNGIEVGKIAKKRITVEVVGCLHFFDKYTYSELGLIGNFGLTHFDANTNFGSVKGSTPCGACGEDRLIAVAGD